MSTYKFNKLKEWLEKEATEAQILNWQKNRASNFISRREYSEKEIIEKLKTNIQRSDEIIPQTIEYLKKYSFLDEKRFIAQQIRSKSKKYSEKYIKNTISNKIADKDVLNESFEDTGLDDLETAKTIYAKKFKTEAVDKKDTDKRYRFLLSRGFSFDIIKKVINFQENEDL